MAANTSPVFTISGLLAGVHFSTANTNHDGTGTLATVTAGSTNGTRLERVTISATGTTTAGMIRLWLYDGSSTFALTEFAVTALTPGATVKAWTAEWVRTDGLPLLVLPSTATILKVSTHNAEAFDCLAYGGLY